MSEEELASLIAMNPDDDAPRRVWADALLMRGDPRGELVSLQCDLSRGELDRHEVVERLRREQGLLQTYGRVWGDRLLGLATEWAFRRGFIEKVAVEAQVLSNHWEELAAAAPLIRYVKLQPLTAHVNPLENDERGEKLRVLRAALSSPLASRLSGIDYAITTTIPTSSYYSRPLGPLAEASLALLAEATPRFTALRSLRIRAGRMSIMGARALSELPLLRQLEHLGLDGDEFGHSGARILLESSNLTSLRGLELNSLDMSGYCDQVLNHPRVAQLEYLSLSGCTAMVDELVALMDSPRLSRLRHFAIGARATATISPAVVRAITCSSSLAGLRSLTIKNVDPESFTEIAAPKCLDRLRVLRLVGSSISPSMAHSLVRWPAAGQLEVLDIRDSKVTSEVAKILAEFDGLLLMPDSRSLFGSIGAHLDDAWAE
jgi:uncharacterized protein (TIGR02996 family)